MIEEWRAVYGYEDLYEVSSLGRVRRFAREVPLPSGKIRRLLPRLLSQSKTQSYWKVNLTGKNGDKKIQYVHVLVMEAFNGPRPEGMQVCHNDGNPANAKLDNLRWGTQIDNEKDKLLHGTLKHGEQHHQAKLTDIQVRSILERLATGEKPKIIAANYNVSEALIYRVKRGEWRFNHDPRDMTDEVSDSAEQVTEGRTPRFGYRAAK